MQMLLSGGLIDAETAARIGLINEAVPASELVAHTLAFARQLAAKSPLTLATGKEAFYRQAELPLSAAYAYASEVMIRNLEAHDAQEGIGAFIEKRAPIWQGR
jgi:enoyl-CoA hydratase/carnithine racemase